VGLVLVVVCELLIQFNDVLFELVHQFPQKAADFAIVSSSSLCQTLSGCSFRFMAESRQPGNSGFEEL
jgi:hypothetical protein